MRLFDIIREEHERLRRMLDEVRASSASPAEKRNLIETLHLACEDHLRAEEADLHDLLELSGGEDLVEDERTDIDEFEQLLNDLDDCAPADRRFDDRLQDVERALCAHINRVESVVFGASIDLLRHDQLEDLARPVRSSPEAPTRVLY